MDEPIRPNKTLHGIYHSRSKNQRLFPALAGALDIAAIPLIFSQRPSTGKQYEMESGMHITGIILAAGTSSRMSSANKLLLPYRNHTVIQEVVTQVSASTVDDILIVTGYERERIDKVLAGYQSSRISTIYNDDFAKGRAESIKRAIGHIAGTSDAALFMVADKPTVDRRLIDRAIERFRRDRPALLYVTTPTGRGHPIIFSKKLFPELLALEGDRVGDDVVAKYANDAIKLTDEMPQIDIDTEDDYRILLKNDPEK